MPTDNRRIQGPETTYTYTSFDKSEQKKAAEFVPLVSKNGKRIDGRKWNDLRCTYMEMGVVNQAKGSAYLELGNTKVICSVYDPREIPNNNNEYSINGKLYCELKFAPFSCKKRRGHQQDSEEKESSYILRRCLESAVCRQEFPNFQVDVYALVLQDDGSALAACITCAGLALAAASVPMFDAVVAASLVSAPGDGGRGLVDPTSAEEAAAAPGDGEHGLATVAYMPSHRQVSDFVQSGSMGRERVTSALSTLTEACEALYPVAQRCLVRSVAESRKKADV